MTTFRQGLLQVNASADMEENIRTSLDMCRKLADSGCAIISMPENVSMMEFGGKNIIAKAFVEAEHPALAAFKDLAAELKVWLHVGSLAITVENNKVANRTYVLNDAGEIAARYDKMHMFDVDLDGGESYRESNTFEAGDKAVLVKAPLANLGLSICYDLRFPQVYQSLAQAGAHILYVPAAFTRQTGKAHWATLLRARAIETGCYVVAAGQCGEHKGGRETYGHSMIIDPWGEVLAEAGDEPTVLDCEIDLEKVVAARGRIPALKHAKDFEVEII